MFPVKKVSYENIEILKVIIGKLSKQSFEYFDTLLNALMPTKAKVNLDYAS